jgi:hypothetical protein
MILDSGWLRCGGEVLLQKGPGFEWGEVPELGVLAEPGAVVLDLDEAEDVGAGRPEDWASLTASRLNSAVYRLLLLLFALTT